MRRLILATLTTLFVQAALQGQPASGVPPFGSFSGGPFDTVNNANLNVHFDIPIMSKAGVGIQFPYTLSYDSSVWYPVSSGGSTTWAPVDSNLMWGWRGVTEVATGYLGYSVAVDKCETGPPGGPYY